jgi:hypothetical protein
MQNDRRSMTQAPRGAPGASSTQALASHRTCAANGGRGGWYEQGPAWHWPGRRVSPRCCYPACRRWKGARRSNSGRPVASRVLLSIRDVTFTRKAPASGSGRSIKTRKMSIFSMLSLQMRRLPPGRAGIVITRRGGYAGWLPVRSYLCQAPMS